MNYELENYDDAIVYFSMAIELNSQDPEVYIYRAKLNIRTKNYQKALNDLNIALLFAPDNYEIYGLRAIILVEMENFEGAAADTLQFLKLADDGEMRTQYNKFLEETGIEDEIFKEMLKEFILSQRKTLDL